MACQFFFFYLNVQSWIQIAVACKNSNFLCNNGKCVNHIFALCNHINDCGDNSDEASCAYNDILNSDIPSDANKFFGGFFGGIFGGIAGVVVLVIASVIMTVITCVRCKNCPLYKQKHRQPLVGVLEIGKEDNIENNEIEERAILEGYIIKI